MTKGKVEVKPVDPPAPLRVDRTPEVEPWNQCTLVMPEEKHEEPDVSRWVAQLNARLTPAWASNELRCGRCIRLPGITQDELRQLVIAFRAFDVVPAREQGVICLTLRPRALPSQGAPPRSGHW